MKQIYILILLLPAFQTLAQVPTNGLAGYYSFTGNANDESGNNYHGTVHGATLTTDRFGNPNHAYHFNGINNYIDLSSHVVGFTNSNAKSISFWVKTNYDNPSGDPNNCSVVFSISNGANPLYSSDVYVGNNTTGSLTNELISMFSNGPSYYYIAGYTTTNRSLLIDDTWHHIVFDFNNSNTLLYLDGSLLTMSCNYGVNNGQYANLTNATIAMFGTRWVNGANGGFMNGDLDDFRVYDRSLTPAEVIQLYNEPNPTLSIDEQLSSIDMAIYPNPGFEMITISWNKKINTKARLILIDFNGKIVISRSVSENETDISLNIQNLDPGVYFVRFDSSDHQGIKKLIIH